LQTPDGKARTRERITRLECPLASFFKQKTRGLPIRIARARDLISNDNNDNTERDEYRATGCCAANRFA
jgi:hypothetical protein